MSSKKQSQKGNAPSKKEEPRGSINNNNKKKQSPAMIATASNTDTPSVFGWIDTATPGSSIHDDGGTVISEITSDHTAFTSSRPYYRGGAGGGGGGGDTFDDILCCLQNATAASSSSVGQSIGTPPLPNGTTKTSTTAAVCTPSTAQSTPDRSAALKTTRRSKKNSPAMDRIDDGSFTDQPSASKNSNSTESSVPSSSTGKVLKTAPNGKSAAKKTVASKTTASTKFSKAAKTGPTSCTKHTAATKKKPVTADRTEKSAATATRSPSKMTAAAAAASAKPSSKVAVVTPLASKPTNKNSKTAPKATTATKKKPPSSGVTDDAKTTSNVGLSELSKQLRVQRAKNEWQHNEIARLERQLRILSDLKGVSVAELRFSLESACQEEAHDELRNQVASLQAQLEALQTQRDAARRRASTATNEAAQSKIATLQLRIGELEEVDHAKQTELHSLYQQLQAQTARATTLEATNTQQSSQIKKFEQVAKVYIQDVEKIQAEGDRLKQQVAELTKQLQDEKEARKLDLEMREIESQLQLEQQKKQGYLNQARMQKQRGIPSVTTTTTTTTIQTKAPNAPRYISTDQMAAIQGLVARQAGVLPHGTTESASTIATSVRDDEDRVRTDASSREVSNNRSGSSVFDHIISDDVSHLGDEMDMSVQTIDALMMQGLSEDQAKEIQSKDAKISSLYDELREQATKASQLQTLCSNQKAQLERFAQQLNEQQDVVKSTQSNYDFAKSEHDALYKKCCDIELQLTLEQEKVEGLERQLGARIHEADLRNDQFKCRFQVQNERIADLEQQQQSLYVAFELLEQEVKAQDSEHTKLKSSLDEADSEVARQIRESEKKGRKSRRSSDHHPSADQATPVASLNDSTSSLQMQEQTPQQQGIDYPILEYGYLWKLDKIKGWKRRFFVLSGEGGVYNLRYSDGPRERVKGVIENITMGVSSVSETNKSIKKPFSFVLHVDPLDHSAPVLYAAAFKADDFKKWMLALKAATIRPEDSMFMSQPSLSVESQLEADLEVSRQMHDASDYDFSRREDLETQIEADRLMALRLNIQNEPNRAFA